jgi:hypothetical protein
LTNGMPRRPEELTTEFLSDLIKEAYPGTTVQDAKILRTYKFGEPNVSTSARVSLELEYGGRTNNGLPSRVLAKMSMGEDIAGDVWCGHLYRHYQNEVDFYNRLRPELDIETPTTVGGRFDPKTKHYVLLLEDITTRGAHFGSMADDTSVEYVQSVLDTLARLHARYWESSRLANDLSWIPTHVDGSLEEVMRRDIAQAVRDELALHKYKREWLQKLKATERQMFIGMCAVKDHLSTLPQTVLHGDGHLGNTYRLPGGIAGLFDWQCFSRGCGIHDVAYLITTSLSIDLRRRNERDLLAFYRDRLGSYGVASPPDLETLWLEHRRMSLWEFYLAWLCAPVVNYGWDLTMLALLRTSTAMEDHETMKVVAELL